jgi:preprotein translocase subunit YajC
MCYRTAEAQQGARARVLNSGILILLIPPVLAMAGIIWFAWRRDKARNRALIDAPVAADRSDETINAR